MLLALGLGACAPGPLLEYRTEQPPSVTLPLAAAGVADARVAFGRVFARELAADPRFADDAAERWLHGVGSATASLAASERAMIAAGGTVVIVVPGLFGDCLGPWSVPFGNGSSPETGSNDTLPQAYAGFAGLGLRGMRLAPVHGRASVARNGERLAGLLREQAARAEVESIVLVAYSKGVADSLHAIELLADDGVAPPKLRALVSVAGTVMGTPVADHFAALYDAVGRRFAPLECSASEGGELDGITRAERLAWLAAHPPPSGIAYYSIVAHQPRDEMSPALRPTARMLEAIDPRNDGQVLAADAILPRGTLLAEARADHWAVALPRDQHPELLLRALGPRGEFPRDALFRATITWVLEHLDGPAGAVLHDDPPRASSARGAHPRATAARPRRS
jgi:hypothetical protein